MLTAKDAKQWVLDNMPALGGYATVSAFDASDRAWYRLPSSERQESVPIAQPNLVRVEVYSGLQVVTPFEGIELTIDRKEFATSRIRDLMEHIQIMLLRMGVAFDDHRLAIRCDETGDAADESDEVADADEKEPRKFSCSSVTNRNRYVQQALARNKRHRKGSGKSNRTSHPYANWL